MTIVLYRFILVKYICQEVIIMIAVLVNAAACIIGSLVGLVCRKGIPDRFRDSIMLAIGICTTFIGIQGALKSENVLVAIISMVLGVAVGTGLDLDAKINNIALWTEKKFQKDATSSTGSFAQGLVTGFLLWCIGAMTIVGSLQAGFGNYEMLYTKSLLDLISSAMLASSLGIGVLFAVVPLIIFQGGLVLLSGFIEPLLSTSMINEITCVGSLMIFALGLNLMSITKIKVVNFLPAILFAPLACVLMSYVI